MKTLLVALSFFVVACGGNDFTAFDDPALDAGAAGDVDPGAGAGGASGTTGGRGGSGGVPVAGSGGEPTAGAGGSADAGASGSSSAGSAGSGAAGAGGAPIEPTCSPEAAIVPSAIPASFNWNGFSGRFDDVDQSYCASSAGGACSLRNLEIGFHGDGNLTVLFYLTCQPEFRAGVCGAESPCAMALDQGVQVTAIFAIETSSGRYRLGDVSGRAAIPYFQNDQACATELASGGFFPAYDDAGQDFGADLVAMFRSVEFTCP